MRLTVNGTAIRVVDRIEIQIDCHKEGEILPNGMKIEFTGGPLEICEGNSTAALEILQSEMIGCILFVIQKPKDEKPVLTFSKSADSDFAPIT